MKKIALSLIASLAFMSSASAVESALGESLRHLHAIETALGSCTETYSSLSSSETILKLKKTTQRPNAHGEVRYKITTRNLSGGSNCNCHVNQYEVILLVTPSHNVGPSIINVISVTKIN